MCKVQHVGQNVSLQEGHLTQHCKHVRTNDLEQHVEHDVLACVGHPIQAVHYLILSTHA
jgi:hypothetical protein